MDFKLIDIVKPSEIGLSKDTYIGAPIILEQGLESAIVADSDNNVVNSVDFVAKKHLNRIDLSKKDSLCIRGAACHEGYIFVTSDGSKGYIIDDKNELVGHFRGAMYKYGSVRDIAVIEKELWGATNGTPAIVKLEPSEGKLRSYESDFFYFPSEFEGIEVVKDISEDIPNYIDVGHQTFISKLCEVEGYLGLLLSDINQEGRVVFYNKKGKKEDQMIIGDHNSWMVSDEGLLYVSSPKGINVFDPKIKRKVDEITDKNIDYPLNLAVQNGKLIVASSGYSDKGLEFLVFEKKG